MRVLTTQLIVLMLIVPITGPITDVPDVLLRAQGGDQRITYALGSADLPRHADIVNTMKAVANRYTAEMPVTGDGRSWDRGVTYNGLASVYETAGDRLYFDRVHTWAMQNEWDPCELIAGGLSRDRTSDGYVTTNPDSTAVGTPYARMVGFGDPDATLAQVAPSLAAQRTTSLDWVDLFFMGFPLYARVGREPDPDERSYFRAIWRKFDQRRSDWFNPTYRLWHRDTQWRMDHPTVFWGRGVGWAVGGIAGLLEFLPRRNVHHQAYVDNLRATADKLMTIQRADGFWPQSLVETAGYDSTGRETSGTALFTYAIAKAINLGLLPDDEASGYVAMVARAWNGMALQAVQADGKLGHCQQGGDSPMSLPILANNTTIPGAPFVHRPFCVGAFLMAGEEIAKLGRNLAATGGTIADFSDEQSAENAAAKAIDGDVTTRWSAQTFPQYITVDLGKLYRVTNLSFVPLYDRAYKFKVEFSTSSETAMEGELLDKTTNTIGGSLYTSVVPTGARYLKLTVTGVAGGVTDWVSVQEFGVFRA